MWATDKANIEKEWEQPEQSGDEQEKAGEGKQNRKRKRNSFV